MYLIKAQRKILLFYSRIKELYNSGELVNGYKIEKETANQQYFIRNGEKYHDTKTIYGINDAKLRKSIVKPNKYTLKKYDREILILFPEQNWTKSNSLTAPFSDNEIGVFKFAETIGFNKERARYIIDCEYASMLPAFSSVVTYRYSVAKDFVSDFGGLYLLYRIDSNNDTQNSNNPLGVVTKATLSIRYPVPFKAFNSEKDGYARIRCKLNIPSFSNPNSIYKYDGFVVRKGKYLQWLFQARHNPSEGHDYEDVILFYTAMMRNDKETKYLKGTMLSQNQNDKLTPTVSTILLAKEKDSSVKFVKVETNNKGKYPKHLKQYFQMEPVEEQGFMINNQEVLYPNQSNKWSIKDKNAVKELMSGWAPLNVKGLW